MRGEVVSLDLETTGLDVEYDAITEIGIVRALDDVILEEYQVRVKPLNRYGELIEIPEAITALTSISNADVANAPTFDEIRPRLLEIIGDRPIIAHKTDFDLTVLKRYGIGQDNVAVDTYELAAILLPTIARYNLGTLADHFQLVLENAHHALDDARATWLLYRKLWELLFDVPLEILAEIMEHAAGFEWAAEPAIREVMEIRHLDGERYVNRYDFEPCFPPLFEDELAPPLQPIDEPQKLDIPSVASAISSGGRLEQKLDHYEVRHSQIAMLEMVTKSFNENRHLLVEAPTGTGKSLAYLIPAAHWALQNHERVVVSTHTINLQDQLLNNDVPLLQDTLGLDVRVAVMKGRSNYLCPRRLETLRRRRPTNLDELRVLAKVMVWLHEGGTGDKSDINVRGPVENSMWNRLSAQNDDCTRWSCDDGCPFHKARRKAEGAHVLIVNHALLFSELNSNARVLPPYSYLVIDEAHHLEAAVTDAMTVRLDRYSIGRKLAEMGNTEQGIFADLLRSLRDAKAPDKLQHWAVDRVQTLDEALNKLQTLVQLLFDEIVAAVGEYRSDSGDNFGESLRIVPETRNHPRWQRVEKRWLPVNEFLTVLADVTQAIAERMNYKVSDEIKDAIDHFDLLVSGFVASSDYFSELHSTLERFIKKADTNDICWVERRENSDLTTLFIAPRYIGKKVQESLWNVKKSVILTSATLRAGDEFQYIEERLGVEEAAHVSLQTPFDYQKSALVFLPNDIAEPNQRDEYQTALEKGIIDLAKVTEGRMLCLFTSYTQLRETSAAVAPKLAAMGIQIFDQGSGTSRQLLVDSFKETDKAVLMGTKSFWEGLDIPGDDLSVVVIARLPFSVPSDPIFAARSEVYGDDSFMGYSMPDAILRFRQGFGRLIRRSTDRGVVAIFDKRIISKRYGKLFLDSLPNVTIQRGTLAQLPHATRNWLGKES